MRTLREYIAKTSICAREHVQVCAHSQACTHTPMRHVRHAWPCAANQLSWALLPSATIDPVTCDTMPHGIPCRTGQASCRMGYLAEDDVLAIEPVARHHGDEELATVQARSGHTRRWSALHTLRRRAARHRTNAARHAAGQAQREGRQQGGVPNPGADVGGGGPSPGADVGGGGPSPGADVGRGGPTVALCWCWARHSPSTIRLTAQRHVRHSTCPHTNRETDVRNAARHWPRHGRTICKLDGQMDEGILWIDRDGIEDR